MGREQLKREGEQLGQLQCWQMPPGDDHEPRCAVAEVHPQLACSWVKMAVSIIGIGAKRASRFGKNN